VQIKYSRLEVYRPEAGDQNALANVRPTAAALAFIGRSSDPHSLGYRLCLRPLVEFGLISNYSVGWMKTWPAILVLASYAAAASQTPHAEPRAIIFGRVLDAETREAVRRVAVKIYSSKDQWDEYTDGEGRFRFSGLVPSDYTLITHRDGYSNRAYKLERSDFEDQKELLIEVYRQGVIAGRVADSIGQALQGATIQALTSRAASGGLDVVSTVETNDLGEYRLSGLDPGSYPVRATYREGRGSEFDPMPGTIATSYYGDSERPADVVVKTGAVLTGINFVLDPARPATIRGTLRLEAGVAADPATLWIMGQAGEGGHNATARNGKFEITDVGPGTYTISAETLDKAAPKFGLAAVEVRGADLDNVEIVLRPMPSIDAEIRVEGGRSRDLKFGSVYFTRTSQLTAMNMEIGHPDQEGKFSVALIPGEYSLRFDTSISSMGIRSVVLDDEPVTDWKIQIGESSGAKKLIIIVGSKPQQ
jgi:Carboxypeptidase regulatory-like domain